MRLHEILNERISLTSVGEEAYKELSLGLPEVLNAWYENQVSNLPFYKYKEDKNRTDVNDAPGVTMVTNFIEGWCSEMLTQIAQDHVPIKFKRTIEVFFGELSEGTNAEYREIDHHIVVNKKLAEQIGSNAYDMMATSFYDNGYDVYGKTFDERGEYNFNFILREICQVFVHELTHAQQFSRSNPKTLKNRQYRSYVVKDRAKFYKMMDKALNDEENRAYLGSPEEQDAFAQELVFKWANGLDDQDGPEVNAEILDDMLQQFNSYTSHTRFDDMKGSDNKMVEKSRRRFLKKVYQELVHRRDLFKKQAQEQTKNPVRDEEYV